MWRSSSLYMYIYIYILMVSSLPHPPHLLFPSSPSHRAALSAANDSAAANDSGPALAYALACLEARAAESERSRADLAARLASVDSARSKLAAEGDDSQAARIAALEAELAGMRAEVDADEAALEAFEKVRANGRGGKRSRPAEVLKGDRGPLLSP